MITKFHDKHIHYCPITLSEERFTVLIFDSGVGGLSVYNEIRQLLSNLHYIYTFDNAAFPYSEKAEEFVIRRVVEIVTAVQERFPLALAVIACNTASTISLPVLREKFQFPIVGVVPAIKPAVHLTTNKIIGLLATCGTVNRRYTHELIKRFANTCQIQMLGSTELVELVEAKLHGETAPFESLLRILHPWLRMVEPPDTIVLGCTHFPLLQDELLAVLPKGTRLIDSGSAVARRVAWLLEHKALNAKSMRKNIAYCMTFTPKTGKLSSILHHYGFEVFEKLTL